MAKKTSGAKKRAPLRVLIVEARFYEHIADALLAGATRVLDEAGAQYDRLSVPGALEVPAAIAMAIDAPSVTSIGDTCARIGETPTLPISSPSAKPSERIFRARDSGMPCAIRWRGSQFHTPTSQVM